MSGYRRPTATTAVSASWRDHLDRDPPSTEPGTDYPAPYGSPLYAVGDGVITYVKTSNSAATGRVIEYRLDDGRTTRSLHLSGVGAWVGMHVARGDLIGYSGASGFGSDWGYGAHVHQTLWPGEAWQAPTLDFELYVSDPPPDPDPDPVEDEMNVVLYLYKPTNSLLLVDHQNKTIRELGNVSNDLRVYYSFKPYVLVSDAADPQGLPDWGSLTKGYVYINTPNVAPGQSGGAASALVTPAWIAGFFLGLIGLVEVVRFIVDLVV